MVMSLLGGGRSVAWGKVGEPPAVRKKKKGTRKDEAEREGVAGFRRVPSPGGEGGLFLEGKARPADWPLPLKRQNNDRAGTQRESGTWERSS